MSATATRTSPGRRAATRHGAASRERILAAAVELIAERGYAATSVEALCRRARVARTALYWHFGSKEGLLAAALERVAGQWIEGIRRSAAQGGTPAERVDRALAGMRALVEEQPQLLHMLLAVAYERSEVAPASRELFQRLFRRAERAIVEGVEDALGRDLPDLDLLAHALLAQLTATSLRARIDPEGTDLDRLFDEMRRTLVLGIGHRVQTLHSDRPAPAGGSSS